MSDTDGYWAEESTGSYDFDNDGVPEAYETYQDSDGLSAVGVDYDHDGYVDAVAYEYDSSAAHGSDSGHDTQGSDASPSDGWGDSPGAGGSGGEDSSRDNSDSFDSSDSSGGMAVDDAIAHDIGSLPVEDQYAAASEAVSSFSAADAAIANNIGK